MNFKLKNLIRLLQYTLIKIIKIFFPSLFLILFLFFIYDNDEYIYIYNELNVIKIFYWLHYYITFYISNLLDIKISDGYENSSTHLSPLCCSNLIRKSWLCVC